MFYSINGNLIENFELHLSEYKSKQDEVMNEECNKMKSELGLLFEKYNQAKSAKDQAELAIENLKKELLEAQKARDITVSNINNAAREYNQVLVKLHNLNCGTN